MTDIIIAVLIGLLLAAGIALVWGGLKMREAERAKAALKIRAEAADRRITALTRDLAEAERLQLEAEASEQRIAIAQGHLTEALAWIYQAVAEEAVRRQVEIPEGLQGAFRVRFVVTPVELPVVMIDMKDLTTRILILTRSDREALTKYAQLLDDRIEAYVREINRTTDFLHAFGPIPAEAHSKLTDHLRERQIGMLAVIILFTYRRATPLSAFRRTIEGIKDRTLLYEYRTRDHSTILRLPTEHREVYANLEPRAD